jgi:hypothetical protein
MSAADRAEINVQLRHRLRAEPARDPAPGLYGARGLVMGSQRDLVIASLLRCPDRGPRDGRLSVGRR